MREAIRHFIIDGAPVDFRQFSAGHINNTCLVTTDKGVRYVLQKINTYVFPDVKGLMENVCAVTEFMHKKATGRQAGIAFLPTVEGGSYYTDAQGSSWRAYRFIEDSLSLQAPRSPEDLYESALAFGRFQEMMADFPAQTLHETIADFHNTVNRYRLLHSAVERDALGRASETASELAFALAREESAGALHRMRIAGELPLRVTHNDTKLNNVLIDAKTDKALCVIDLDTVMPGLSLYDFGDSIRFGASTSAEDEKDLSRVHMDLKLFRIYTRGYVRACPSLTLRERELLPLGAWTITLECGVRFLTDYLDGDKYFSTSYPGQNLDRTRVQLALARDMEQKWDEMNAIVSEEASI